MPELPEVETVKNELMPVIGRRISGAELLWERTLLRPSPAEFQQRIAGRKIEGISRRGKYLIFALDSSESLIIHLRMTGSLILGSGEPPKYTRVIILLDDGSSIFFRDPRKFGKIQLVADKYSIIGKLGPEPLEAGFTPELFTRMLKKKKAPLKAVLLDQSFIAGIGNMYADEALFCAGIHPMRAADSLSDEEAERLHRAIIKVLLAAIAGKGASVDTYYRPGGERGSAQQEFKVAHRKGECCPVCNAQIERIRVRQRGSYYCPHCQPQGKQRK